MLCFSISGGMSTGLLSLFRELSIKDDKLTLLSSDDIMVARKKRRHPESVEAHSSRKSPPGKPNRSFHKSIRRQLKKRESGSLKRPESSSYNNKNNLCRPNSLSKNDTGSTTSRGRTCRRRNSKGRDVASCPTWRQLTIQRSGTENESRTPGRNHKLGSKCGPAEVEVSARNEPSDGKMISDCSRRNLHCGKPNGKRKNLAHESGDQASQVSHSKQYEVNKKSHTISNKPRPSASTYPDVGQPSIVLMDCQKMCSDNPHPSASKYSVVRQPRIVLVDCLKASKQCPPKLHKNSPKNKTFRNMSDCDESGSQDSVDDGQPTRRRSGEQKSSFHVPTWRQLTKRQSLGSPNLVNEFERKVSESDDQNLTVARTWRPLTMLQSGSSEHQNVSESDSHRRKTSPKNEDSKIKKKRRPSEEKPVPKRATEQSADLGLLCQSNNSLSNHRPTPSTKKSSKTSSKFRLENQKSDVLVLPTWRQLSIKQSDVSTTHEKSLESYQKRKRSVGSDDSNESVLQEVLPKARLITLTTAMKVPAIQISRADSQEALRYKKPKTSISARQEILPKTEEITTVTAKFQVPTTQICDTPKSSAPSRSAPNKYKKNTSQDKIPMDNAAQPKSKPSASDATKAKCLQPFPKITIPGEQGEKPHYECSMCDYRSNQLGVIWDHVKIHDTGVKPYACNECDYRAKTDQLLSSHKITHAGEKPYACDLCDQRFRIKTHLRLHQIVLHNGKPLACHECSFKTADEGLLQRHLTVHRSS